MQYRIDPKSGNRLSILGFGCMRFPRNMAQIDFSKTEGLVLRAVREGINYFDTAYIYGGSEETLGRILQKHNLRDQVFLASKLPTGKCREYGDFDRLFATQLERLRTDRIDYYLIHHLSDESGWKKLCEMGIERWIRDQKKSERIGQIGFSFHGMQSEFMSLLDAYDWDFCQIQYNYIQTQHQAGEAGLKRASEKGLPVIIMEPLLGGKLSVGLPKKALSLFAEERRELTPTAWALRWLWDQKEVTVVLSGMNDEMQIEENRLTACSSECGILSEREKKVYDEVREIFEASYKFPCTECRYCMPCPHGVNIPGCFSAYNLSFTMGKVSGLQQYVLSTGMANPVKNHGAGRCTRCGRCEMHCPQHISIISSLVRVKKKMEPAWLRFGIRLYHLLTKP